jgi:hypothetical protein
MRITEKAKPRQIVSQTTDGNYSVILKPSVYMPSSLQQGDSFLEVIDSGKVEIPFQIDLDVRQWGVKGITVSLVPVELSFDVVIADSSLPQESEYTRTINFDPSKIPMRLSSGSSVTIYAISLKLNRQFLVDYDNSSIDGYTLISGEM